MEKARYLLQQLTEEFPPPEGQRHNISLVDGDLEITLMLEEGYRPIRFEERDYHKWTDILLNEIVEMVRGLHFQCE